jgi:hypothetical protein
MMVPDLNAETDFAQLVDGLESIELLRRNNADTLAISAARRLETISREANPSDGLVQQADAVWHLQMPTGESAPKIGDVFLDSNAGRWTILERQELSLLGRWRCETRDLSVAFGCQDRVDVERAVWDDLGSGPEIVDWVYAFTALPVKIQPDEIVVDTSDPPVTKSFFQIIFSQSILLQPDDRFVAEDGTVYLLQSYEGAERIDRLPVAKVLRKDD